MKTVRRLLCATDLSAASRPAWEHAQHLGRLFGAEVLLLHVLPVAPVPRIPELPWNLIDELRQIGERQAREGLDALLDGSRDSGVKTRVRVELGTPTARILEVARDPRPDRPGPRAAGKRGGPGGAARAVSGGDRSRGDGRSARSSPDRADLLRDRLLASGPDRVAMVAEGEPLRVGLVDARKRAIRSPGVHVHRVARTR
jgi:hypothetical protein